MTLFISRLGRVVTRGRTFIPEVDGLRFVAIAFVVLYHLRDFTPGHDTAVMEAHSFNSRMSAFIGLGHYGVQLFFVLSGFLLAMPFAKWRMGLGSKPSLRKYYLRRLTRLEPPYVVAILLLFLLGVAVHIISAGASKWPDISYWPHLIASLFYQHNVIYGTNNLITPVAWSLEIEVQFYLLAPLLAVAFSVRNTFVRRSIFLLVMIALPLLRGLLPADATWTQFNTLPWHLEFFATGFLLADLFLVAWKEAPRHSLWWDCVSLIGWPILIVVMMSVGYSALLAPAVLLCYIATFRGRVSSWILSHPLLTVIGGMCYSIYLLHYTVIMVLATFTRKLALDSGFSTRFALDALIILPAVMFVSVTFYILLERPCMDPAWPKQAAAWFRTLSGAPRRGVSVE